MGAWRWIRDVIADRGENDPIAIFLERDRAGEYVFRLGVRAGFGGQEVARISVNRRLNPERHPILKEIYSCEVAGRRLEAANVFALRQKVALLLDGIAPARSLPLAYFRVPAMDYELPVYEDDGDVVSPVLGGPKLRAGDLAGIRQRVCRYLISAGYVSADDDVTLGVLRPRDLRLVQPATVLRSYTDPDTWMPAVEGVSADGPVVGVLGNAARLAAPERQRRARGPLAQDRAPAAPDVISLLRLMRVEVARSGSPERAASLYLSDVRPELWAAAEERTTDTRATLVAYLSDADGTRLEMALRRSGSGELVTALEDRGINVFLDADAEALARAIGRYLYAGGFLRFPEEVEVHAPRPPRPERLPADEISTFGDRAVAAEPEEVQPSWQ
jgi:hypothetical protein